MNFPSSSPEQVRRRYVVALLGLLQRQVCEGVRGAEALRTPVDRFQAAGQREADLCLTALFTLAPDDAQRALDAVLADAAQPSPRVGAVRRPRVLGPDSALAVALGRRAETAAVADSCDAWRDAWQLLVDVDHPGASLVSASVLSLLGLKGAYGHVRAFSDPKLPGFLAIGVSNPPGVVAEQLVHESVHTHLWCYLQLNPGVADTFGALFGAHSNYVKRARSAVRIAHGALSYGAVCSFWLAVRQAGLCEIATGVAELEARSLVDQRIETLRLRVGTSLAALRNICRQGEFQALAEAAGLLWCLAAVPVRYLGAPDVEAQMRAIASSDMGAISKAEIILAVMGHKQTRSVLPVDRLAFLDDFARAGGRYVIGREAVVSAADDQCAGFSNVVASAQPLDGAGPGTDVFVYFGQQLDDIEQTARLDAENGAGTCLGIPACCQEWFRNHWEAARTQGGDLFARLLLAQPPISDCFAECNAAGMYVGRGLCWHFPCSPTCEFTRATVRLRAQLLSGVVPALAEQLVAEQHGVLLFSSLSGYCFLPAASLEDPVPAEASWTNGTSFSPEIGGDGPARWVARAPSGEARRVLCCS
ncbi:mod_HExxH: HEXXH motif domain protein [Xylophilus ampelinus]|nr:mod_HExxH: HEXXH motif domain protein [Xylophilus ampelinus]